MDDLRAATPLLHFYVTSLKFMLGHARALEQLARELAEQNDEVTTPDETSAPAAIKK